MSKKRFFPWIIVGFAACLVIFLPIPSSAINPQDVLIHLKANRYAFNPGTVRVNQGDLVTLELAPTDVAHGVYIDGYDLELSAEPGKTTRLSFPATRPGVFRLRCSVACGDLHPFMIGKLEVGNNFLLWRAFGLSLIAVLSAFLLGSKAGFNPLS